MPDGRYYSITVARPMSESVYLVKAKNPREAALKLLETHTEMAHFSNLNVTESPVLQIMD